MEVIKKNIFAIVCGVVALFAIVSIFFPMGGMFDELRTKVGGSRETYDNITGLLTKERTKPSINFLKPDEKAPLEVYPTRAVIAEGEKVVAEVKGQADKLLKLALEMNTREPLSKRSLPAGRGADLGDFKRRYYLEMKRFVDGMNATVPPTPNEIAAAEARLQVEWNKQIQRDAQGQAINEAEVNEAFERDRVKLPQQMKKEKAGRATMYIAGIMEPDAADDVRGAESTPALDYHSPGIPPPASRDFPLLVDVWIAQLSLWIQDDIVRAIIDTNTVKGPDGRPATGANGQPVMPTVERAAIKQLVRIVIPKEYIQPKGPPHLVIEQAKTAQATAATETPAEEVVVSEGEGVAPAPTDASALKAVGASATARASNPIYDVMHFYVTVDIEADNVPIFLDNLTKNRFNTILSTNVRTVDLDRAFKAGYVYGNRPVVRLDVKGETIFFRDWTKNLMPQPVKNLLGIQDVKAVASN